MAPRTLPVCLIALVTLLVAGCGGGSGNGEGARIKPVTGRSAPSVDPEATLPAATGEVVLRMRAREGRWAAALDLATLRRLPHAALTVTEPFRRRTMAFRGVRVSDLLAGDRVPDGGEELAVHALDDYHVKLPLERLRKGDALLAWEADGAPIPVSAGGPIRIVFPDDSPLSPNRDNWIWSVDRMDVL